MPDPDTIYLFWSTLFASAAILTFVAVVLFCLNTLGRLMRRSMRRWRRTVRY